MNDPIEQLENEKVIGSIIKKDKALVVRLNEFKGCQYVDIRRFFQDKTSKKFFPTQKGISIPSEDLSAIITLLEKIESEIQPMKEVTAQPGGYQL